MANQIESPDGKPHKDESRPSPDVGQAIDGQSNMRGTGTFDQRGDPVGKAGSAQHDEKARPGSGVPGSPATHTPLGPKPDLAG